MIEYFQFRRIAEGTDMKKRIKNDAVWPVSGLWISLGDTGHLVKEAFLDVQEYLLSDAAQNEIQKTGRRTR